VNPWRRPLPPDTAAAAGRVAVKICGVTDADSALRSVELGADYLGLNFWPGSPRHLSLGLAAELAAAARAARPDIVLVGVFVDPTPAEVEEAAAAADLDLAQFSGDETAAAVRPFAARAIKARRLGEAPAEDLDGLWGVLYDTPPAATPAVPGAGAGVGDGVGEPRYGGTGRAWDYAAAARLAPGSADNPAGSPTPRPARLFLAGGLGPHNARRVVADLRPFAIDVCSRVESSPGRKDPVLLRQLFEEVRNGQASTAT
jgi:phosphoribosylanthranilate isomerase